MKINLAKSAGFCFGVKRAIKIAMEAAGSSLTVEMIGDIVHNEDVTRDIRNAGIKKVEYLARGENKALLIRAHGAPLKTFKKAEKLGYRIIDATCPMVHEIHRIAVNMERARYRIIVIGDKDHDEVQGIVGQLKSKPLIIEDEKNIPIKTLSKMGKSCVVVQSTQNVDKVNKIFNILRRYIKDLKTFNTICDTTRAKQNEIKTMPLENDVMIIIGSGTSANTRRLYEISKSLNKNSFWVQSSKNIRKAWFKNAKNIGVTAGASTPDYTTKGVIKYIKELYPPVRA